MELLCNQPLVRAGIDCSFDSKALSCTSFVWGGSFIRKTNHFGMISLWKKIELNRKFIKKEKVRWLHAG